MKKNIHLYIVLLVLQIVTSNVHAQHLRNILPYKGWYNHYAYYYNQYQNEAEFVFEGKVIAMRVYSLDSSNNTIVISKVIKVTKVFRGNLKVGLVEKIEPSKIVMLKGEHNGSYGKMKDTCIQIFFCNASKQYKHDTDPISAGYTFNNNMVLESEIGYILHDYHCTDTLSQRICGYDSCFKSKASLYNFLRNEYHIAIPKSAEEPSDTIEIPTFQSYCQSYNERVLHIKPSTDSERVAMEHKRFRITVDSLDSLYYLHGIQEWKRVRDSTYKAQNSPLYYQYYWDGSRRRFWGEEVDPRKKKIIPRNGFDYYK
jgi:hypothetical protein